MPKSQGPLSRKSRKAIRNAIPTRLFCNAGPGKFCASGCRCFEDTKGIMSLEIRPKSFGTFEKRVPGVVEETNRIKEQPRKLFWMAPK